MDPCPRSVLPHEVVISTDYLVISLLARPNFCFLLLRVSESDVINESIVSETVTEKDRFSRTSCGNCVDIGKSEHLAPHLRPPAYGTEVIPRLAAGVIIAVRWMRLVLKQTSE